MQLIKVDLVEAQSAQAAFASGSQVFGLSVLNPFARTGSIEAAFGGDHQACRIRVKSLCDDLFTHSGTVGIGGVDEIYPQFDSPSQNPNGLRPVRGLTPNAFASDSHCAKSQARNAKIASQLEFARC